MSDTKWSAVLVAATIALAASCGESEDPPVIEALVVVQETNLGACVEPFSYELEVTRRCDGGALSVRICAETPLCDEQLDDLTDSLSGCEEERTQFRNSTAVPCP